MTREEIEHTLKKNGYIIHIRIVDVATSEDFPQGRYWLDNTFIYFSTEYYPRISYQSLTPELLTELTGLELHKMPINTDEIEAEKIQAIAKDATCAGAFRHIEDAMSVLKTVLNHQSFLSENQRQDLAAMEKLPELCKKYDSIRICIDNDGYFRIFLSTTERELEPIVGKTIAAAINAIEET